MTHYLWGVLSWGEKDDPKVTGKQSELQLLALSFYSYLATFLRAHVPFKCVTCMTCMHGGVRRKPEQRLI